VCVCVYVCKLQISDFYRYKYIYILYTVKR
jgi:hypothetical protein